MKKLLFKHCSLNRIRSGRSNHETENFDFKMEGLYSFSLPWRSPIVVINAAERKVGQDYVGLTGAIRTLVDDYKLRVIVDGSLGTTREEVIGIKPMTKEMIWKISQLQDLFKFCQRIWLGGYSVCRAWWSSF